MKEQKFWVKIRPYFQKHLNYVERIENKAGQGTPDVFCLNKNGRCIWVELKSVKNINELPEFQKQQPVWHFRYALGGGVSVVLVNFGDGMYWVDGADIQKIKKGFEPENKVMFKEKLDNFLNKLFKNGEEK